MGLIISIYILGVLFAVIDLASRVYEESDRMHSFAFCVTYVLFRGDTWKHTLKSWYYFIETWGK